MRIWKYNIENVSDEFIPSDTFNIWIDLKFFHYYIQICRTDWNKTYKDKCLNYCKKCKHNMDCPDCKQYETDDN